MNNIINNTELPLGFSIALARNLKAMEHFSRLSEEEQQAIVAGTHQIHSKREMQAYVDSLVTK